MNNREETIQVKNLVTGYKDKKKTKRVTDEINASLLSGELTCLLGPNGAGKSTLLKTLSGFLPPISGEIEIEGKSLYDYKPSDLAKVIGVVLTEKLTLNNMSVEELVGMGRAPYTGFWGKLSEEDKEIVDEAISLVKIDDLRHRMVNTLSDGERQKVMIAKALSQQTPVIFLDEPTAFLDYPSKVEIMQLLQLLSREKRKTVFLSTHDLELALQIADKVWLIDKVNGVDVGTPEDLALDGSIGRYFSREGVLFDMDSGLFKINHNIDGCVMVKGKGHRFNLLAKALARYGKRVITAEEIATLSENKDVPKVEIIENGYLYKDETYHSIETLIHNLLS